MAKKKKNKKLKLFIEFVKVNLAGNVMFWVTYALFPVFYEIYEFERLTALVVASIIGNIIFFIIDKQLIFIDKSGKRKTSHEVIRFVLFMSLSFIINITIIEGLAQVLSITPYIGQFISAVFFSIWNFIGLKFWVFQEIHHHALTVGKPKRKTSRARRRTPQQKTA